MTKETLKLALEVLEFYYDMHEEEADAKAITAIKEALANEALEKKAENARELGLNYEPEPVAWITEWESKYSSGKILDYIAHTRGEKVEYTPLYTTQPQRTWVGLTDEEMDAIYEQHHNQYGECESANLGYERAIEAKLKEKNT